MKKLILAIMLVGAGVLGYLTPIQATYITSQIKSIQYGSVTILNAATSASVAISLVNLNNAAVRWLGNAGLDSNNPIASLGCVQLQDATHVLGSRAGGVSGSITIGFVVTEYLPQALKQPVQQKTISITDGISTSVAVLINQVNISKTELVAGGSCAGAGIVNGSANNLVATYQQFTDTTHIAATRASAGGNDSNTVVTAVEFR